MITVSFENRGDMTLCDYLCEKIKMQIKDGSLAANEKLPSKRTLSLNLGVSVITVQNAYARLISEGYIYSIEKKGFFVTELFKTQSFKPSKTFILKEEAPPSYFTDFASNAVNTERFPFNTYSHIMRQVLNSGDEKLLAKSNQMGARELRNAIATYLREFRAMDVTSEQIVIGAGSESLYTLLVNLLGREKRYAIENPGYKKVYSVFAMNGSSCIPIAVDTFGMDVMALGESGADIAHISPSHHFPTGIVMPVRRRQELLSWAYNSEKEHYIIEDDYDSEFRFAGKPLSTLQSEDKKGCVIYMNTFSKTLSPSFRIGYLVLPKNMVPLFKEKFALYTCPVSSFEQYALARFIQEGHYGSHIIRMKNYYRSLRNELIRALESSEIASVCSIHEEEAGLHFLLSIKEGEMKSAEAISFILKEKYKIRLPLISNYFYGEAPSLYKNTFLVNYSGIAKERIAETVQKIEDAFCEC